MNKTTQRAVALRDALIENGFRAMMTMPGRLSVIWLGRGERLTDLLRIVVKHNAQASPLSADGSLTITLR